VGLSVRGREEKEKVLSILRSLPYLSLDAAAAAEAGAVYAQRLKEKARIDSEDAMLAGIAIENKEPLLTRNRKDFAGIPGLKCETY
jgi:predicted nucleic acid-binding protein